ncbi:MAG: DUF2188 domain-containing protein [Myxococcota bacterium]
MRSVYKVFPDGDRWSIVAGERSTPLGMYPRKQDAVKAAKEFATADLPSVLVVHSHAGVEAELTFGTDTLEPA